MLFTGSLRLSPSLFLGLCLLGSCSSSLTPLRADDKAPPTEQSKDEQSKGEQPKAEEPKSGETKPEEKPSDNFQAIITRHNQAAIEEVKEYVNAHPDAEDVNQAYGFLFQNALTLESDADAVAIAEKYLARESIEPQLKVVALQIRSLGFVNQGKYEEALKVLGEILGERRVRNPGSLVDFGFLLANRMQLEGNIEAVKECYEKIGEAYPLNPQLESMIETRLDRLSLIGKPAPELKGKDWEGKQIDLKEYRGKVLLIDFWATNCGPCLQEMPNVLQCYTKFNPQGFEVLAVSFDEVKEQAESLIKRAKIPWRQAMNETESGELSTPYYVPTIPAMYLVDQEGNIAFVDLRGEDLRKAVEKLLNASESKPGAN